MPTDLHALSSRRQALLERMVKKEAGGLAKTGIPPLPRDTDKFVASISQQRTWLMEQLVPGTPAYNSPITIRLKGKLDISAFARSLEHLVARHETLRTHFEMIDGVLCQIIKPVGKFDLKTLDLRNLDESELANAVHDHVGMEEQAVFNLSTGPLFTALLLRLPDDEHGLVLNMHHIIVDGWSHGIILRELGGCYIDYKGGREPELEPLSVQYADFAQWQSTKNFDRDLGYWNQALGGTLPVLNLPLDRPRPARPSNNGASVPIQIPLDTLEKLRDLGKQEGASLFMVLLAAFKILLFQHTGQTDIIVGSATSGRTQKEENGIIGDFANTLALRTKLDGSPSFHELLQRVRSAATGAYSHQTVPFELIVQSLPPSRSPIFQTTFGVNSLSMPDIGVVSNAKLGDLEIAKLQDYAATTATLDLIVYLWETPVSLSGSVLYNTDIFDRDTVDGMMERYLTVTDQIAANPDIQLLDFNLPDIVREPTPTLQPGIDTASKDYVKPTDAIEESLCKIWADALGLERVGIDDNFFDLGGHSLLAFRLMNRIKEEFDPTISIAETFRAPTIRKMARMIRLRSQGELEWSPLVPLKLEGTRAPFFCAPVYGGSAFYYRTLASFVGEDQPLYALEPKGLNGVDEPHTSIEEMAAYYIGHMRTVQPAGPYALCGLSLGGVIAFEIARQLQAASEKVGCLILFDTWAPGYAVPSHSAASGPIPKLMDLRFRILSQFEDISAWPTFGERIRCTGTIAVKFGRRIVNKLRGGPRPAAYVNPNSVDLPDLYHKLVQAEMQALNKYRPERYAGHVLFLKARLNEFGFKVDTDLGWRAIAPDLEVVITPGTHYTVLEDPCIRSTIGHINKALSSLTEK